MFVAVLLAVAAAGGPKEPHLTVRVPYPVRFLRPGEMTEVRVYVRLEDPDGGLECPAWEWSWGDGTKSSWATDCEPGTVEMPGERRHSYPAGRYTVEVTAKSSRKTVRGSLALTFKDGSEEEEIGR